MPPPDGLRVRNPPDYRVNPRPCAQLVNVLPAHSPGFQIVYQLFVQPSNGGPVVPHHVLLAAENHRDRDVLHRLVHEQHVLRLVPHGPGAAFAQVDGSPEQFPGLLPQDPGGADGALRPAARVDGLIVHVQLLLPPQTVAYIGGEGTAVPFQRHGTAVVSGAAAQYQPHVLKPGQVRAPRPHVAEERLPLPKALNQHQPDDGTLRRVTADL